MPSLASLASLALWLLAVPLASAAAARRATRVHYGADAIDSTYHWSVAGWTAACSDGACSYAFNVSGPYSGGNMPVPAFAASCAGAGVGAPYRFCQLRDDDGGANTTSTRKRRQVAARLLDPGANATTATARLDVSFQFDDLNSVGAWWNYTAYTTHTYGQNLSFTMAPSEVYGVA